MAEGTDYECPQSSLQAWGTPTPYIGPPCVLGTLGGGVGAHWGPPVLSSMTSERIQRSEKGGEAGSDPLWPSLGHLGWVSMGRQAAIG